MVAGAARKGAFKISDSWGAMALLARLLNESSQTVSNWRNRGVSAAGAIKAETTFGTSAAFILYGTGPMYVSDTPSGPEAGMSAVIERRMVPVYGAGSANPNPETRERTDGDYATGDSDRFGVVATSDRNAFLTRVEDNSMWPRFINKSYALVEPNTSPEIDDDVLVKRRSSGQTFIKRLLSTRGGTMRLGSYNAPEVLELDQDDVEYCYYVAHPVPAKNIVHRLPD